MKTLTLGQNPFAEDEDTDVEIHLPVIPDLPPHEFRPLARTRTRSRTVTRPYIYPPTTLVLSDPAELQ